MGDKQLPWEKGEIIEIEKIQSTESSSRIEGIITTNARYFFMSVQIIYDASLRHLKMSRISL